MTVIASIARPVPRPSQKSIIEYSLGSVNRNCQRPGLGMSLHEAGDQLPSTAGLAGVAAAQLPLHGPYPKVADQQPRFPAGRHGFEQVPGEPPRAAALRCPLTTHDILYRIGANFAAHFDVLLVGLCPTNSNTDSLQPSFLSVSRGFQEKEVSNNVVAHRRSRRSWRSCASLVEEIPESGCDPRERCSLRS